MNTLKNVDGSLGDVRLKSATIYEKNKIAEISVVSDAVISESGKNFIASAIKKRLPEGFKAVVSAEKAIADADIAKKAILDYLQSNCASVGGFISENDVNILKADKRVVYEIAVTAEICDYLSRSAVLDGLNDSLNRNYSNDFSGGARITEKKSEKIVYEEITANESEMESSDIRRVKMKSVFKYCDDALYDTAVYIADGDKVDGQVYFAGAVVSKEEKITKKGKPFFVITLNDKTGEVSGNFFTADQNKIKKLKKVEAGSVIIVRGENETYNGRKSLIIRGYHFCEFPDGYEPLQLPSKRAPEKYSVVFPEKSETARQDDFFTVRGELPYSVKNDTFTVVDVETTGTDPLSDKVTEIGAIKIVNGVITEQFQTLINPRVSIPERITELTGIDDELVKDAPFIEDAYPDFYKFLGDTAFIGHNVDFDFRFLRNAGKSCGFDMKNKTIDTLSLSRKILPGLAKYKLNVVCEHYGITFHHHRALSDAYATAELFLELMRDENKNADASR